MGTQNGKAQSISGQTFTFSQSSLQDYTDCPRRFQLRYLDQVAWPAVECEPVSQVEARQREAVLFHRLVQQDLLGVPRERLARLAASGNLERWWQNYLAKGPSLEHHELHAEEMLGFGVGRHRLVCKYDLLAIRNGRAVIYDWKTFRRRPSSEWLASRLQTKIYRAVLVLAGAEFNGGRSLEPADISMIYWFSEFPDDPAVFPYDGQQFTRDAAAIETLVAELEQARIFPMTELRLHCRSCAYRSLCDRGEQAGPAGATDGEPENGEDPEYLLEQIREFQP
jgi:hypothetical protein